MICLKEVRRYCQEYWKIENYQEAVNDQTQTWHCHHRHEIDWVLSRKELIVIGRYYDVHYSELIFLTPEEHTSLHRKGIPRTSEEKSKISDKMKGENNPNYGKEGYWKGKKREPFSEESKQKMSVAQKGKHHTEETKQKMSDSSKGEKNPNYKYHITKEELYDLYVVQGLSTYKIAEIYGCGSETIRLKLKKYNIKK